jgi:hypothetical protein
VNEGKALKALRLIVGFGVIGYAVVFLATVWLVFALFPWESKEHGIWLYVGAVFFAPIGAFVGLFVGGVEAWVRRGQE